MKILDEPRYVCALGAMQSVQAINRAIPVIHAGPGCAGKLAGTIAGTTGDSGYLNPQTYPCTNIGETEIVFGGEDRLREVITNSLKVMDGDLFVVLSGCTTEIVGDDIDRVVSEFAHAEKPIISVSTPGFKGTNIQGHEWVINSLINQYLTRKPQGDTIKGLVNIWGPVPSYDPYWLGNIRELENLVSELGLTPNSIFGEFRGIENVDKVPQAEFNLLVSPWVGLENMQLLQEKFGTPFLHYPTLPIGAHETSAFLRAVSDFAGLDRNHVEALVEKHEKEYYYYLERSVDIFFENRTASKMFTTVTTAANALAVSKFLINDLGLMPNKQFITEGVPEEHQERVAGYFKDFSYGIEADVVFSADGYDVHRQIEEEDFAGAPLIIGSIFEKKLARKLDGNFLCISVPIKEKVILHSTYAGYHGGLKLMEDIFTNVYQSFN
ncbi:Nitrogenase molybdenum-iron protein beta chain [Bacteroidales bacterium Barb6]|nr:Nitrogenase molybdenum-iron protein beta chain [Bacteroidales bacterium Barb6]